MRMLLMIAGLVAGAVWSIGSHAQDATMMRGATGAADPAATAPITAVPGRPAANCESNHDKCNKTLANLACKGKSWDPDGDGNYTCKPEGEPAAGAPGAVAAPPSSPTANCESNHDKCNKTLANLACSGKSWDPDGDGNYTCKTSGD